VGVLARHDLRLHIFYGVKSALVSRLHTLAVPLFSLLQYLHFTRLVTRTEESMKLARLRVKKLEAALKEKCLVMDRCV